MLLLSDCTDAVNDCQRGTLQLSIGVVRLTVTACVYCVLSQLICVYWMCLYCMCVLLFVRCCRWLPLSVMHRRMVIAKAGCLELRRYIFVHLTLLI